MKKQLLYTTLAALAVLSSGAVFSARADLTYTGLTSWDITGDFGDVLALNGITVASGQLITGTTLFYDISGNVVAGTSSYEPAANSDDFSLATTSSSDAPMAYIQTLFPDPTTMIFLLEKNGNDSGTFQGVDASGNPVGAALSFSGGAPGWVDTGYLANKAGVDFPGPGGGVQNAWGTVITSDTPIHGIRLNSTGIDPVSIIAVVPEPATIGLLGLGVLMLLQRKR